MKFRCPYCGKVMEQLKDGLCPFCSKAVRLPGPPPSEDYVPRARRAPSLQTSGGPLGFFTLFSGRPSFALWVIAGALVVVAGLLMFRTGKDSSTPWIRPTKEQLTRDELGLLHTALEWFRQTSGRYPTTKEGLDLLVVNHAPGWDERNTYLDRVEYDLWGSDFHYSCSNDTVSLFSLGPDKLEGTADDLPSPGPDLKEVKRRMDLTNSPAAK